MKHTGLTPNKFLSDSEYQTLLATLARNQDDPRFARDCILLQLLAVTGARAGEVLALTAESLSEGSVHFHGSKGSSPRSLPVPVTLFKRLQALAKPGVRLFPISGIRLRQIWYFYRPVKKKLHSLRHTFAVRGYQKTLNLKLVQRALGHRSIMNTMIYLDYAHDRKEFLALL